MPDRKLNFEELKIILDGFDFEELHVHHTWKPNHSDYNGHNLQELQNNMRNYHMNTLRWDDIAQHLTLAPDGRFITGRKFGIMPCSIKGYNSKYVLMVEMIGNFDIGYDKFEGKQKESMMKLTQYCFKRYMELVFHNEYSAKSCPGSSIDKAQFIKEVGKMAEIEQNEPSSWSVDAVTWAVENNISDGMRLKENCTREEVLTMLYRMTKL